MIGKNKKGIFIGWQHIIFFFAFLIVFIAILGIQELANEEIYKPISDTLKDQVLTQNGGDNTTDIYLAMVENDTRFYENILPYNIIPLSLHVTTISTRSLRTINLADYIATLDML